MSRFHEAAHYVIAQTRPEELGKTKLAKVLFFADLESYRRTGKPITEAVYIKKDFGPVPRQFYDAIARLAADKKIAERRADYFGRVQHQFWSLVEPKLEGLSALDVATLTEVARGICDNHTAASISDLTHNAAWELARDEEEIPFAAYLAAWNCEKVTPAEIEQIESVLGG